MDVIPRSCRLMSAAQEITPRIAPPSTIKATLRPSAGGLPLRQRRARSLSNSIVFRGFTPKIVALMRCFLLQQQQFAFRSVLFYRDRTGLMRFWDYTLGVYQRYWTRGSRMRKRSLMLVVATALVVVPLWTRAETLPNTVDDKEFWRLITDLSEPGGRFQQQFMSNEDSFQFVIPGLKANTQKNGVYLGVGSE